MRSWPSERTGTFTTGIVSLFGERRIVLYATGHQHGGENLERVLSRRPKELPPPTQMCDALVDPFHYLTSLLRHAGTAAKTPEEWMPWNYKEALARAASSEPGP